MVSRSLLCAAFAAFAAIDLTDAQPAGKPLLDTSRTPDIAAPKLPEPPLSAEKRGDIFMARKYYREAVEAYSQAPKSAVIFNKIGIAHHQMMQLDAARKWYQQALKLQPDYSEAINNLGAVYYAQKSYRKAIGHYKKALKISPKSASIYSNLGTAYFARKKYKDALEQYQTALSIDPEVFEHKNSWGSILQERTVAERARFHFYLAKTYAKAGNKERALQYIRMALEEGFKERDKLMEDAEFAAIRDSEEFQALLKLEPRVL